MNQWVAQTPDGHELRVRRAGSEWIVSCGQDEARSDLLDVAMMEAVRGDAAVYARSPRVHVRTMDPSAGRSDRAGLSRDARPGRRIGPPAVTRPARSGCAQRSRATAVGPPPNSRSAPTPDTTSGRCRKRRPTYTRWSRSVAPSYCG